MRISLQRIAKLAAHIPGTKGTNALRDRFITLMSEAYGFGTEKVDRSSVSGWDPGHPEGFWVINDSPGIRSTEATYEDSGFTDPRERAARGPGEQDFGVSAVIEVRTHYRVDRNSYFPESLLRWVRQHNQRLEYSEFNKVLKDPPWHIGDWGAAGVPEPGPQAWLAMLNTDSFFEIDLRVNGFPSIKLEDVVMPFLEEIARDPDYIVWIEPEGEYSSGEEFDDQVAIQILVSELHYYESREEVDHYPKSFADKYDLPYED